MVGKSKIDIFKNMTQDELTEAIKKIGMMDVILKD